MDYINAFAQFKDDKTVAFNFQNKDFELKAKNFVVAAGNRPRDYPGVKDLEKHAISSDDLFSL